MKGKIIIIVITSIIIYLLLVATLYLATPFMLSWGSEKVWYLKCIEFLQDTPFNLVRSNGEVVMKFIYVNAFFWTICLAGLLWLFTVKLSLHKRKKT